MQKCRSGTERVPTQFKSFWHPAKLLTNCLLMVLPVGRKKQASNVSLETSMPIHASIGVLCPQPCVRDISSYDPSSQVTVRDNGHLPAGPYLTDGVKAPRNPSRSVRPAGAWALYPRMLTHKESGTVTTVNSYNIAR